MSIPQPRKDEQGKVIGDFYPLQRAELIALRKTKLINNAAYVHLALRYENPYCDRPIEILPKEFAMRWQMPESSVYEAIGKLREEKVIEIKYGKVIIQWVDSQQDDISGNPESAQPTRIDSEFSERSLNSQKKLRKSRKKSEIPENQPPKPLPQADSKIPHTIQTYSDFIKTLSENEREKFLEFGKNKAAQLPKPPELPLKWVEVHFEEIASLWRKTPAAFAKNSQWQNHSCRVEWLDKIRSLGFAVFIYENGKLDKERHEFFNWANANNLIWGGEL